MAEATAIGSIKAPFDVRDLRRAQFVGLHAAGMHFHALSQQDKRK
jgi:hypothetical protein